MTTSHSDKIILVGKTHNVIDATMLGKLTLKS